MFDIGMTEILVVAVVAIIVVGPKDLPGLLRTAARYVGQLRSMARDFQSQMNDALRESELEDLKNTMKGIGDINPVGDMKNEFLDYMASARALDVPDEAVDEAATIKTPTIEAPKGEAVEKAAEAGTVLAPQASETSSARRKTVKKQPVEPAIASKASARTDTAKPKSVSRKKTPKSATTSATGVSSS